MKKFSINRKNQIYKISYINRKTQKKFAKLGKILKKEIPKIT